MLLALALGLPVTDARRLSGLGRPAGRTAVVIDISAVCAMAREYYPPSRARIAAHVLDGITDSVLVATAGTGPAVMTHGHRRQARAAITALRR